MKVIVPKEIYESDISERTLAVYILTKFLYTTVYFDKVPIDAHNIAFYLGGVTQWNRITASTALEEIYNNQLLDMDEVGKHKYIINGYETGQYYAQLEIDDVVKILENHHNGARYKILKYYTLLMGSRMHDKKVCCLPLRYLAEINGINVATVEVYNRFLEENKIIYIYRNFFAGDVNKNNIYCAYKDKHFAFEYAKSHDYVQKNSNNSDWKRSVSIKYNNFVKNPKKYSDEERFELREKVKAYNKEMDRLSEIYNSKDYIGKKKDISVFNS